MTPVVDVCLQCHAGANRVPGLTFNLGNYNQFFERRGSVFRRAVLSRTMPPTSGGPLDDERVDMLERWLLGGAPQ